MEKLWIIQEKISTLLVIDGYSHPRIVQMYCLSRLGDVVVCFIHFKLLTSEKVVEGLNSSSDNFSYSAGHSDIAANL